MTSRTVLLVALLGASCRPVVDLDLPPDVAHVAVVAVDSEDDTITADEIIAISELLEPDEAYTLDAGERYVALGWPEGAFGDAAIEGALRPSDACDTLPTPIWGTRVGSAASDELARTFPALTADGASIGCTGGLGCIERTCVAVAEFAISFEHTCARLASGKVACTGRNELGQAGVGTDEREIAQPRFVEGVEDAIDIGVGHTHTCAVHEDGHVSCWGSGRSGQLGDGARLPSNVPVRVADIEDAVEVTGGSRFTCARLRSGEVWCWGGNEKGQLGDGTDNVKILPVQAQSIGNATGLVTGWNHACVVRANGTIRCWGENGSGQIGTADNQATFNELREPVDAKALASSDGHTCAVTEGGDVYCWGINNNGQCAGPPASSVLSPRRVALPWPAEGIYAGGRNTCAYNSQDEMRCWGQWEAGLIENAVENETQYEPFRQSFGPGRGMDIDSNVACRIVDAERTECWGANARGALGIDPTLEVGRPHRVEGVLSYVGVGPAAHHACGFDEAGALACWGRGGVGQTLRDDDRIAGSVRTAPTLLPIRQLKSSATYSCARHDDRVSCWGSGFLGIGETKSSTVPVEAVGLRDPVDLDISDSHACAVLADGRLMCWGNNPMAFGIDMGGEAFFPVVAPGIDSVQRVAVGRGFTCVLRDDGSVACMGANLYNQLGHEDGATHVARRVEQLPAAVRIDAALDTTCVVTTTGDVYCWGRPVEGIRTPVTPGDQGPVAPNQIEIGEPAVEIAVGFNHACALGESGRLWCWGGNFYGQTGIAGPTRPARVLTPTRLDTPTNVVGVEASEQTTCAWNADGDAWCFGSNVYDQLGATSRVEEPVEVDFLP